MAVVRDLIWWRVRTLIIQIYLSNVYPTYTHGTVTLNSTSHREGGAGGQWEQQFNGRGVRVALCNCNRLVGRPVFRQTDQTDCRLEPEL